MAEKAAVAPVEYKLPDGCEDFLVECMKENLNHARHVENERMLFVTLFAALAGGVLAVAAQMQDAGRLPCVLVMVLIFLNLLCTILVCRWNTVFSAHMRIAKEIYNQILSPPGTTGAPLPDNKYYYFHNRLTDNKHKPYITTGWLFIIYNCAVLALLVAVCLHFWV